MKIYLTALILTFDAHTFAQDKIPALDINRPPESAPKTTISTIEEASPLEKLEKENGCILNFDGTKSLFIQDKKLFKEMSAVDKNFDLQTLEQKVILGNKTSIRFLKSECNHRSLVINIVPKKIYNHFPHQLYRQTLQLLNDFKIETDEVVNINPLKKSLTRNNWAYIKPEDDHYILPCIDTKCTLKVIKYNGIASEIELTYEDIKL